MSLAAQFGNKNVVVLSDGAANIGGAYGYYGYGSGDCKGVATRMINNGYKIAVWNIHASPVDQMEGVLSLGGTQLTSINRAFDWFNNVEKVDLVEAIKNFNIT